MQTNNIVVCNMELAFVAVAVYVHEILVQCAGMFS